MSKLAEIQFRSPGARLRKLVSEVRAGHPEIPQQVAYVSGETLTDRAIERSWELVQAHDWHQLVLRSALLIVVMCLVGCTSYAPIDPQKLPTFGDPLPGTIHVLVLRGFERPGHYYLSEGATLGLLVDLAELKPLEFEKLNREGCWYLIAVGKPRPTKNRLLVDRDERSISLKDRRHRLKDSDQVQCTSISW